MITMVMNMNVLTSRNPYFSGFSLAIGKNNNSKSKLYEVAILILVDFPLQLINNKDNKKLGRVAILILVDFPLQ